MAENHGDVGGVALVDLLDDEGHPLQGVLRHFAEKIPGGRAPGVRHREDKENEVGHRQKALGDALVPAHD